MAVIMKAGAADMAVGVITSAGRNVLAGNAIAIGKSGAVGKNGTIGTAVTAAAQVYISASNQMKTTLPAERRWGRATFAQTP